MIKDIVISDEKYVSRLNTMFLEYNKTLSSDLHEERKKHHENYKYIFSFDRETIFTFNIDGRVIEQQFINKWDINIEKYYGTKKYYVKMLMNILNDYVNNKPFEELLEIL